MGLKDNERRAKQWCFTIPTFDNTTLERLSNPPRDDVAYLAFAVRTDDTGRDYVEGYVKMKRRTRVAALVCLIGYGFFDVCETPTSVTNLLTELKTEKSLLEFGDKQEAQHQCSRKDLVSFKRAVELGLSREQLGVLYPQICSLYPGFVNNCLIKANRVKPLSEETIQLHSRLETAQLRKEVGVKS